jgi:nucleoside-diphosphate-sugar epimerase
MARVPEAVEHSRGIEIVSGDLQDKEACMRAMDGVGLVYHIAAAYREASLSRAQCFDVNFTGTRQLYEAAVGARAQRFVHCSTVGVHGEIKGDAADEEAPFAPGDAYQDSKVAAEQFLREQHDEIEVVIFRPTGIYGPGDLRLLKFVRLIARGKFFMIGNGAPRYHLTYIDDLIDGIIRCGEVPEAAGEVFILGGPEAPTLNEWARIVAETVGVSPPRFHLPVWPFFVAAVVAEAVLPPLGIKPPIFRRRMDFFTKNRSFCIGKARRALQYDPTVGVREGMKRTVAWYREAELIR